MRGGKLHVMKLKGWCPQYLHVGVTGQSGLGVSFRKPVRHQQRRKGICDDIEADSSRSPEERRIIHVLWDEHTLVMQLLLDRLRRTTRSDSRDGQALPVARDPGQLPRQLRLAGGYVRLRVRVDMVYSTGNVS